MYISSIKQNDEIRNCNCHMHITLLNYTCCTQGHADLLPFYDFSMGVSSGTVPPYLELKKPVPVNGARWRNHFTRKLSVYCRTRNPSNELKLLVDFIQKGKFHK